MPQLELPIFPLNLVLFPGAPHLLHIFEPRYRRMLADAMEADRRFGISFVDNAGADPSPGPGTVGCRALVRASTALPDGRSNILVVGEDRYTLLAYVDRDRPYRMALVDTFGDDEDEGLTPAELTDRVREAFVRFASGMAALTDQAAGAPELPAEPAELSFVVSAALEIPLATQQDLLALRSTAARLRTLERLLESLNEAIAERVVVHLRGRRNGKGGRASAIAKES